MGLRRGRSAGQEPQPHVLCGAQGGGRLVAGSPPHARTARGQGSGSPGVPPQGAGATLQVWGAWPASRGAQLPPVTRAGGRRAQALVPGLASRWPRPLVVPSREGLGPRGPPRPLTQLCACPRPGQPGEGAAGGEAEGGPEGARQGGRRVADQVRLRVRGRGPPGPCGGPSVLPTFCSRRPSHHVLGQRPRPNGLLGWVGGPLTSSRPAVSPWCPADTQTWSA